MARLLEGHQNQTLGRAHPARSSMSSHHQQFYIDGAWVDPKASSKLDVINPATELAYTKISLGNAADVDRAVAAAKGGFPSFARPDRDRRLALVHKITA